jgi:hypothetical protein
VKIEPGTVVILSGIDGMEVRVGCQVIYVGNRERHETPKRDKGKDGQESLLLVTHHEAERQEADDVQLKIC